MKRIVLTLLVWTFALSLISTQEKAGATALYAMIAAGTCEKPTNYKDCAAECDSKAECKKCCARGRFSDAFDTKCKNRCDTTFSRTLEITFEPRDVSFDPLDG